MTTSPRLPAGLLRRAAGAGAEVTEAELNRMTELALRRDARTVTIGHGRSAAAAAAVAAFARRWEDQGRIVLDVVTWPERPRPGCVRLPGSPPRTRTYGSWRVPRAGGPR